MMFAPEITNLMAPRSARRRGIMSGYCRGRQRAGGRFGTMCGLVWCSVVLQCSTAVWYGARSAAMAVLRGSATATAAVMQAGMTSGQQDRREQLLGGIRSRGRPAGLQQRLSGWPRLAWCSSRSVGNQGPSRMLKKSGTRSSTSSCTYSGLQEGGNVGQWQAAPVRNPTCGHAFCTQQWGCRGFAASGLPSFVPLLASSSSGGGDGGPRLAATLLTA